MSNTEIIKKLRVELEELRLKIMNLQIFVLTMKYMEINTKIPKQGMLLSKQLETMVEYENILIQRIALIQDLIDNGNK